MSQIILKSMHKCGSYGLDQLNCDPELQPTLINFSNDTPTPQGQPLSQIILKSMHKCRCYGPDKLNL